MAALRMLDPERFLPDSSRFPFLGLTIPTIPIGLS